MRQCLYDNPLYSVNYDYPSHQGMVLDGLNALRQKEELVDISLIIEGQTFKAHRVVLSACSDYFRAMFTDNMLEAQRKEICLNGISAKGFLLVLEYIYTCKITLNLANVQDVLEAASHVQMLALIETCSNYLEAEIDIENCVDIATIAETYSLTVLKMEVYRFMNENLRSFSNTSGFYRLTPSQLETLLAYDLPVDCSEYDVLKIVLNYWFFYANASSKSHIEISYAIRIFRHVNFKDIPRRKLQGVLHEMFENQQCEWELYKVIVSEIYAQISSEENRNSSMKLLNSRGMELAVLKIGGFGIGGITNEITYKFSSKSKWKHLTKIPHVEQCNYGTAVLNNELYIIGGCFNQGMQENVHPFGFRYSPLHNKWSTMTPMKIERCRFSLNVLDGKMYSVGGVTEVEEYDNNITCTCECYDPVTDEWTMMESLPVYLTQHAGASYENANDSKLFISGGIDRDNILSTMFRYDVNDNKWTVCAPMLTPRADHVMLCIDNFLYVCGGWKDDFETETRTLVDTIDVYNVDKDCWSVVTKVPTPRYHAGIISISKKIYFIGGFHSDAMFDKDTAAIECYDIDTDTWSTENKYPEDVWEHTCTILYVPKCRDGMDVISPSTLHST